MPAPIKVLFVSSEVAPYAKTGGLADVVGALPKALRALGMDVRVVMPLYAGMPWNDLEVLDGVLTVPMWWGGITTRTSMFSARSAFGSAPATSARPPVFANGAHSEATNRTFNGGGTKRELRARCPVESAN